MNSLVPVVVGFLLTTVLGGLLGFVFQRRSWSHQHGVQSREQERERAVQVFEEVSRLLDKRLYRLRLLYWSLPSGNSRGRSSDLAHARMDGYRDVLYEWNDGINRNLALVQQYFGDAIRYSLDHDIGIQFIELGRTVEDLWNSDHGIGLSDSPSLGDRLQRLSGDIYRYNISMIRAIQDGAIGVASRNVASRGSKEQSGGRPPAIRSVPDPDYSGDGGLGPAELTIVHQEQ